MPNFHKRQLILQYLLQILRVDEAKYGGFAVDFTPLLSKPSVTS